MKSRLQAPKTVSRLGWTLLAGYLAFASQHASGAPAAAHAPSPSRQLSFRDQASVVWTLVPAVVYGRRGLVERLGSAQFQLWVDDLPVPVESFDEHHDAPLSVLYLQDLSGSMANEGKLATSREFLRALLHRFDTRDEIALASFASGATHLDVPFGHDRQAIESALEGWRGYGTTAVYDALSRLPGLHRDGENKRAAILVTDGIDNASKSSAAAARELLLHAELPVYVLALSGARRPPKHAIEGDPLLRQLARVSGGRYFAIRDSEQAIAAGDVIVPELRHLYTLGFQTRGDGPIRQRTLRVEVTGGGRSVRHRQSYLGFSPSLSP